MSSEDTIERIREGSENAYIDGNVDSEQEYTPRFITNNGLETVINEIEGELNSCVDFEFSVAFITEGGLTPLKQTLYELTRKGKKGRIITTDYLTFSEPRALEDLSKMDNIELRMYQTEGKVGFHTKGYIFHDSDTSRILIGSSNLTHDAIIQNHEWNTRVVTVDGSYKRSIEREFEFLWKESTPYQECKAQYEEKYRVNKDNRARIAELTRQVELGNKAKIFKPNDMQVQFVQRLSDFVDKGFKRAILVSATGTGKTFASAFGVQKLFERPEFKKDRVLFLSHREQINRQSLCTFYKVLGGSQNEYGLLSGNDQNYTAKYLFSTMQMMSRSDIMSNFNQREFSIIILDECHRAGAASYQKIIDYFKPKMLLGMSASPERSDGFNIYDLFNYHIACDIRLQDALKENFLCPFHYFGITDLITIDDENPKDDQEKFRNFAKLTSDERVKHVIEMAKYFGHSGERVKGLVFCSRNDEAVELSRKFNEHGYKTIALSGADNQDVREKYIDKLTTNGNDYLDYIFTVDIFNEGVDIPEVNQVILLRPTQSAIIFIQQLGRGLRKAPDKEFVVVLDFIGNYNNNYIIPMALSGDKTGNKDNYRKFMHNPRLLGGATIHFDEISKEKIYRKLDEAKMNELAILKSDYKDLKFKLGRIPSLMDFDEYDGADPMRFINKCGSYYSFLVKTEKEYNIRVSSLEEKYLEFVSTKFASGKRPHELEYLSCILDSTPGTNYKLEWDLRMSAYDYPIDNVVETNVLNVLSGVFYNVGSAKNPLSFLKNEGTTLDPDLLKALKNPTFRTLFKEIVDFGLHRYKTQYSDHYKDTSFVIGKKYTYDDACRLLCWEKNEVGLNIGGYKYDDKTKTYPVYINYVKGEEIQDTIKYEDRFIDQSNLIAISKQGRTTESNDVQYALNSEKLGIKMLLFVRKNKDDKESKEFYFLGSLKTTGKVKDFIMPNTGGKTAVEIHYRLDEPVENGLYNYITK